MRYLILQISKITVRTVCCLRPFPTFYWVVQSNKTATQYSLMDSLSDWLIGRDNDVFAKQLWSFLFLILETCFCSNSTLFVFFVTFLKKWNYTMQCEMKGLHHCHWVGVRGQGDFLCRYKYNIARTPLFKFVLSPICSICLSGLNFFFSGVSPLTPPPSPLSSKLQLSTQGKLQLSLKTTETTNFIFGIFTRGNRKTSWKLNKENFIFFEMKQFLLFYYISFLLESFDINLMSRSMSKLLKVKLCFYSRHHTAILTLPTSLPARWC